MKKPIMANNCKEWSQLKENDHALVVAAQANLPVQLGPLAKALGLDVKVATLGIGISGEIAPSETAAAGFRIRINKHEVKTRQRFTLAHEIAHYLLHRDLIGDGVTDSILFRSKLSNVVEAEANRLAADILMPYKAIKTWRKMLKVDSAVPLAAQFDVSEDAIRVRLGLR
jgi:predicted transcriptional regulator